MKILIISDAWHPQVNGVVRTYEHLCEQFVKMGHDVKVIGPEDFSFRMPMPGYPEIELAIAPYHKLAKMIERYHPDRVHISVEGPLGWAGRKYCKKHGIPFSTSYHTQFPQYFSKRAAKHLPFLKRPARRAGQWFVQTFHSAAKAMMVATETLEKDLRVLGFKNKTHRLTRGVNLEIFHPGEKTLFQDLKGPVALYVGRVAIEKNMEAFLEMEWHGSKVVVGDGPSRKALEKKYPDAVFVGKKVGHELAEHYRSADVFVFPSKTDTFGIVLIEALACGLPVAAYPVIGPLDIITEPQLGVLDEDLATASRKALECGDPQYRFHYMKEHYTWEKAAEQFLAAFEDKEVA